MADDEWEDGENDPGAKALREVTEPRRRPPIEERVVAN